MYEEDRRFRSRPVWINEEELDMLLEECRQPDSAMLLRVLWETGCRIMEVLNLRAGDVDFQDGCAVLHVDGKTGPRPVPVCEGVGIVRDLIAHRHPDERLFPLTYLAYYTRFQKIVRRARGNGLTKDVTFHSFRHSAATRYLRRGMPEQIVKKMMGWAPDSSMLNTYCHMCPDDVVESLKRINGQNRQQGFHYDGVLYN